MAAAMVAVVGDGGGGEMAGGGERLGGGLGGMRLPQSAQSVPHLQYGVPPPPSSHSPSLAQVHVLRQPLSCVVRVPQSWQSLPSWQTLNSLPGPPSSQSPSWL